jgi:hypothetical protein
MRIGFLIGGLALAVLVIGALQWWRPEPEEVVEPVEIAEPQQAPDTPPTPGVPGGSESRPEVAEQPEPTVPEVVLPPLDASDEFVRLQLVSLALPEQWLEREDLVRRFAVVVDNSARGEVPVRQLSFLTPAKPFRAVERGGVLYLDPANYQRFDVVTELLISFDPATVASLSRTMSPLIEQALGELGNVLSTREQLLSAIDQILAAPVRRDDIPLLQPNVLYEYAEPRVEALSPLQKQLLRMGPDNTEKLKAYLTRLRPLL